MKLTRTSANKPDPFTIGDTRAHASANRTLGIATIAILCIKRDATKNETYTLAIRTDEIQLLIRALTTAHAFLTEESINHND